MGGIEVKNWENGTMIEWLAKIYNLLVMLPMILSIAYFVLTLLVSHLTEMIQEYFAEFGGQSVVEQTA